VKESRRRLSLAAVVAAGAGAAAIALSIVAHQVAYLPIDVTVTQAVQGVHSAWLTAVLSVMSTIGFPPVVDVVYGVVLLWLFAAGKRWESIAAAFTVLSAVCVSRIVKALVARPRPPAGLIHVAHHIPNPSFPAGHVLNFTAFAGFLCYLVATQLAPSWRRTTLIVACVLLTALMGLARIDAGEHWLSDVLGGYAYGALCLVMGVELYCWGKRRGWGWRRRSREAGEVDKAPLRIDS
jgi:membrane-associated phospholipid phosphatase